MFLQGWPSVEDDGPNLKLHWINVLCLLSSQYDNVRVMQQRAGGCMLGRHFFIVSTFYQSLVHTCTFHRCYFFLSTSQFSDGAPHPNTLNQTHYADRYMCIEEVMLGCGAQKS